MKTKHLLLLASSLLLALASSSLSAATVRTWSGASATSGNWTTAANWQGNVAPVAGDVLSFPDTGARRTSNTNNFPAGTAFSTINIFDTGYRLRGNGVTISNYVSAGNPAGTNTVDFNISAAGPGVGLTLRSFASSARLTLNGDINLNARTLTTEGPGDFIIAGVISGSGGISKGNSGDLSLSGSGANTFTGTTFVNAGIHGRLNLGAGTERLFNVLQGAQLTITAEVSGDAGISLVKSNRGTLTLNGDILASAPFATALGNRAAAAHTNSLVWADGTAVFSSTRNRQVRLLASGGVDVVGGTDVEAFKFSGSRSGGFASPVAYGENSNTAGSSAPTLRLVGKGGNSLDGVLSVSTLGTGYLAAFGNASDFVSRVTTNDTWTALASTPTSDRNAKDNFKAVDADGVALAAIQGLNQKLEQKLEQKETEITELKLNLSELKALGQALSHRLNGGSK